jgi:hypothetical protein
MALPDPIAVAQHRAEEQKKAVQATLETLGRGQEALTILEYPGIKEFFIDEAVDAYKAFLVPGADLPAVQARGIAVNLLYQRLATAVAKGRTAAVRLDEIANQGGPK